MLTITVYGGLGNQLFQLFTLLAYHYRTKQDVALFRSLLSCNRPNKRGEMSVYWDTPLFTAFNDLFKDDSIDCGNIIFTIIKWIEREYVSLEQHLKDGHSNVFLQGCFQSYHYFEQEKQLIFQALKLDDIKRDVSLRYNHLYKDYSKIATIHFRIGDYSNLPQYHPILPIEYYANSLKHLFSQQNQQHTEWKVLYFYEPQNQHEVDMKVEMLKKDYPEVEFIPIDHSIEDWEQMILMSLCRCNIIANSTFSWWGAYFNTFEDKKVYYPSLWHGPYLNYIDTNMLFPESWTKISIE